MMRNEKGIQKAIAHLQVIYGLANDLNGEYGDEATTLMRLYSETFNHITLKLLPSLGMSEESIHDLCVDLGETYDPYMFKPSIVAA